MQPGRGVRGYVIAAVVGGLFIAGIVLASIYATAWWMPDWSGLPGDEVPPGTTAAPVVIYDQPRDLWDWAQLLLVPLVIAVGGYLLTRSENREARGIEDNRIVEARKLETERIEETRRIEEQRAQDIRLKEYLDAMTTLLLERRLRASGPKDEVRSVGRTRTLSVLSRLDGERKGAVVQFLHEAKLLGELSVVALEGADLHGVILRGAYLSRANLAGVNLRKADLQETFLYKADLADADLKEADLQDADLQDADLRWAALHGANLRDADLRGADLRDANLDGARNITTKQLASATSIDGAILPEGITHEDVEAYRQQHQVP